MPITGHKGLLSVPAQATGSVNQQDYILYHLVNTSTDPFQVSYSVTEPSQDATAFASTAPVVMAMRPDGLAEWTASFSAHYPKAAARSGHLGNVTFGSGTAIDPVGFTINWACQAIESTAMADVPPTWKSYIPGLWSASGTYQIRPGATTVEALRAQGAATFRLTTADTANTLAGSIHLTGAAKQITMGQTILIDYPFAFDGQVTTAGTNGLFPAGVLTEPEITEIGIRSLASRIATGNCFIESLSVSVQVGSPIAVTGTLRGTGALVPA